MNPSAQTLPTIRLALGDDFEQIQKHSTYKFPRKDLRRIDVIAASEPVTFEYTGPGSFTMPPARSFSAAIDDQHVVSLTVSPQLRYISLEDALQLLETVRGILRQGNWQVKKQYTTLDQMRARFEDSRQDSDLTVGLESWRHADDEVMVELARHWRREESLPRAAGRDHDLFVLSLKMDNDRVSAAYPGR
jgi:hypothetical protein